MGPRLFSRGNVSGRRRPCRDGKSFNGAATLQPRKCEVEGTLAHVSRLLQWGRDSSAAEIRPRNTASRARPAGFNGAATLQPRKLDDAAVPPAGATGFNGAATLQPRKFLSWQSSGGGDCLASMGPRLFSRGNNDGIGSVQIANLASMGPRLFSRGNGSARPPE